MSASRRRLPQQQSLPSPSISELICAHQRYLVVVSENRNKRHEHAARPHSSSAKLRGFDSHGCKKSVEEDNKKHEFHQLEIQMGNQNIIFGIIAAALYRL